MSLPTFLLESVTSATVGGELTLEGAEGHHAAAVRRIRTGERIDLTDGRGSTATCTVTSVGKRSLRATVEAMETVPAEANVTAGRRTTPLFGLGLPRRQLQPVQEASQHTRAVLDRDRAEAARAAQLHA